MTEDEMLKDLAAADAAGDTQLATTIASRIKAARAKPAPVEKYDPTEGMSTFEKGAAGAGKAVSDLWLGARQLAASAGLGDKEKLAAQAAESERLDKPLMSTGAGFAGNVAGNLALTAVPFGAVGKATQAAGMIPKLAGMAGLGAGQGLLTPDAEYDPAWQAGKGAALNLAGEGAGRTVGRILRPMQGMIPQGVKDSVEVLKKYPGLLAENISGNPTVRAFTNALAQIPVAGSGIKAAREANLGKYTQDVTATAGRPTSALTPEEARQMEDALTQQYAQMRAGPDVDVSNIPTQLTQVLDDARRSAALLNKQGGQSTLSSAIGATSPIPSPVLGPTGAPARMLPAPPLTANEAITARSVLSDMAHGLADSPKAALERKAAQAAKGALEDAIEASQPDAGKAFQELRKKWGAWEDIKKTPTTETGRIKPEEFLKTLEDAAQTAPRTPLARETVAAAHIMKSPALSENRSLMVRALMGGIPLAGAAAGGLAGGDLSSTGAGAAGSLALASALLGTRSGGRYLTGQASSGVGKALQSEEAKRLARLLGITTAQEFNR